MQGRPRPVRFTFGLDYITFLDVATAITLIVLLVVFIRGWRRNPGSPVMLMFLCTTLIVWQDPIMNWSPFAVYNPDLIHWPESWPLVSLSPSVEPFVVFGYVMFYFGPYFPAVWILRKLQARKGPEAFVSRHPLICLGLITMVIGFIMDAFLENTLIHWGMYIYSQVIPWGSVFTGTTFQFPLIWESFSVTFVMVPAAILCYRDDTGKSVAEKLAAKAKIFPSRPVLGTFLVMFAIINVSYFAYGAWFWAIKISHAATSVACPWPYPEAKVYDPQGFYEKAGAQGPYSVGIWSTWASGEPNGRPHVDPPPPGQGACAHRARMGEPRTVVITGASRGLGFASAVRLYREGWRVVAAMRTPDRGMPLLREATGAREDDDRLIGVQLDLMDAASISAAAKAIDDAVGAPYALVHNAGISAAGMVEETDMALWQKMFATHVMGPVALTQALLPSMRAAGEGRIVLVASTAGVRGQPATAPYSASKGAMERWGESMACEIAPFGLGVTVLVTGTYDTEIITDAGTIDDRNFDGPYARLHNTMNTRGRFAMRFAQVTRAVHRRTAQGARRPGVLPPPRCGPGRLNAVGVQQDSAGFGHAPHVPDRAGHTQAGFDAGRGVAVDDGSKGHGVRRTCSSGAGVAALGVAGGEAPQRD